MRTPIALSLLAVVTIAAPCPARADHRVALRQKVAAMRINLSDPHTQAKLANKPWTTVYSYVRPDVLAFDNYIVKLPDGTNVVTRVEGLQDPKVISTYNASSKSAYHDLRAGGRGWEVKPPTATGQRWVILGKQVGDSIMYLDARERRLMRKELRRGFRSMFDGGRWVYSGYKLEWEQHDGTKTYDL